MAITLSGLKKEKKIPPKKGNKLDDQVIKNNLNAFKAITEGLKDPTPEKIIQEEVFQIEISNKFDLIENPEPIFFDNSSGPSESKGGLKVDQKQVKSESKVNHKVDQKSVKSRLNQNTEIGPIFKSRSKVDSKVDHEVGQKQIKSGLEVGQKTPISLIVGLQKRMLDFLFEKCLQEGSKTTNFLGIHDLALGLETNKNSIKSGIRQLRMKGAITKTEFKDGRSGGTKYTLSEHVYSDMLQNERGLKVGQKQINSRLKVDSKVDHKVDQSPSSSSSFINNNKTTTEDLLPLDLKPLESINFSKHHLKQILDQKILSDEEIQKSIDAFSFDLTGGHLAKVRSPLNFFMKILKNGSPYASDHYQDPEDKLLREKLEQAQREKIEKERMRNELFELKFNEWLEKQEKDELKGLVPFIGEYLGQFHRANLKEYFRQEVFSERN